MSLNTVGSPPAAFGSGRFFRIGYLPTYVVLLWFLVLIWAGAPGDTLSFTAAWSVASGLGVGELVLISVAIVVVASVLHPMQLSIVQLLEVGPPRWLGSELLRQRQLARKRKIEAKAILPQPPAVPREDQVRAAGLAGSKLRQQYPLPDYLVRPTAFGNALTAMEDTAGRMFGLDAVVAWPRLYTLLGESVKTIVDDRRDALDGAVRMAVSGAVATVGSTALLWGATHRWWLLALIPAAVSVASYRGAVQAALAYGEAVQVAFDMHRFDLLASQKLELPATPSMESAVNRQLCDLWRQGVPLAISYGQEKDAP
ncbi:hypothetical protein ABZ738_28065 [Micromonospora sp. NPDC047793]|uniref:hypothetical protein n=1 Tax=Micromonospora sp. NPDC047793 TaxID=3154342 RepID=UPI003408A2F0